MYGSVTCTLSSLSVTTERTAKTAKAIEPNEEDMNEMDTVPINAPAHAEYVAGPQNRKHQNHVYLKTSRFRATISIHIMVHHYKVWVNRFSQSLVCL